MRIYSPEESTPAAVITLATPESNEQPILFQTKSLVVGKTRNVIEEGEEECNKLDWVIKAVTVTLARDWGVGMARITLVCNVENEDNQIPKLPLVNKYRGGVYPYLTIEDEIRIYMGYISDRAQNIDASMLDEIPIRVTKNEILEDGSVASEAETDIDEPDLENKKLVPVFWGFIEKVDFDGYAKGAGYQIVLSCRDRTRVLSDTTLLNIPSINGIPGSQNGNTALPKGRLSQIVSEVAKAANGSFTNVDESGQEKLDCWKRILVPNQTEDLTGEENNISALDFRIAANKCEYYSAYDLLNRGRVSTLEAEVTKDPSLFVRRAVFKIMDVKSRPRFHMWLSRPPLSKNGNASSMQIFDKSPLTLIKWVALREERSMDFFASHVNGDFCLVPRVLDTSGFNDPVRMYRTYFFRGHPKNITVKGVTTELSPPCENQMVMALRSTTAATGSFNRFTIIDNSALSDPRVSSLEGIRLTIDKVPYILDGGPGLTDPTGTINDTTRRPTPPCRHKLIYDGNLGSYGNSYGGAMIVAQSVSAQLARDISNIEIKVIGDPTFYPGEAIRVYNTFLHDEGVPSQTGKYTDLINKEQALDKFMEEYKVKKPASAFTKDADVVYSTTSDNEEIKKIQRIGIHVTNATNLDLPVYKIRSIEHTITAQGSNAGFVTTVEASLDLNN